MRSCAQTSKRLVARLCNGSTAVACASNRLRRALVCGNLERSHTDPCIIIPKTDTVAVRMAHYIKLMRLGSNENRPTSIATLSSFEGRLTDASFCKFASFEKNLVVATDANTVYTVDTTAGTSQRVIAPQRTLVSPRDIIRHVSYAHHPRIFLTCTHGAVALKDSRVG